METSKPISTFRRVFGQLALNDSFFPSGDSLISLSVDDSVRSALTYLSRHCLHSAPVLDNANIVVGIACLEDFTAMLVALVKKHTPTIHDAIVSSEEPFHMANHPLEIRKKLQRVGRVFFQLHVSDVVGYSQRRISHVLRISDEGRVPTLLEAIELMAEGVHSVCLADSAGRVVNTVAQSLVTSALWLHHSLMDGRDCLNLRELGLGVVCNLARVPGHLVAYKAFSMLQEWRVSAAVITDENGHGVEILSVSDMKHMVSQDGDFLNLFVPVRAYLARARKAISRPTHGFPFTVTPISTLGEVIRVLAEQHKHRVYVRQDADSDVTSVITLTDILRKLLEI
eukprot:GCRY01002556.1.p1 GENE.GCRY01002556.1~~GCRY01002556.1.p1  ORF type:complete len:340 (-),score=82.84 GCRY01002556.1:595-1614(-)